MDRGEWKDYELLDCGDGEKLERWGRQILVRPDPQAIWGRPGAAVPGRTRMPLSPVQYRRRALRAAQASEQWTVQYGELTFNVKPMNFSIRACFPNRRSTGILSWGKFAVPGGRFRYSICLPIPVGPPWPVRRREPASAMSMQPKAWWPGRKRTPARPVWRMRPFAGSG